MSDLKQIVANNIIKLRKEKKLTQAEFANKLNYSDKAVSKWERAESTPDIIVLKQISDLFGISVDYLLNEHTESEKLVVVDKKKKSKLRKSNLHIIYVIIERLEKICLEIMNKILSELMKDSKFQEVNLVEKKKIM